jgi:hypothetical protein
MGLAVEASQLLLPSSQRSLAQPLSQWILSYFLKASIALASLPKTMI